MSPQILIRELPSDSAQKFTDEFELTFDSKAMRLKSAGKTISSQQLLSLARRYCHSHRLSPNLALQLAASAEGVAPEVCDLLPSAFASTFVAGGFCERGQVEEWLKRQAGAPQDHASCSALIQSLCVEIFQIEPKATLKRPDFKRIWRGFSFKSDFAQNLLVGSEAGEGDVGLVPDVTCAKRTPLTVTFKSA
jgi:hypothetical protein